MPTDLTNRYYSGKITVNTRRIKKLCNWLLKQCNKSEYTVSILLVDDRKICQLNRQYRGKNQPTNVIAFPFSEGADPSLSATPIKELGDIVISIETAFRESIEYNHSFDYRIAWLLTHGMLHLLGYDHEQSDKQAEEMYSKENELLCRLQFNRRRIMTKLAINVDHVATIRQARGVNEPDPVAAAAICELAGASGIVVHLREDRRHMQDRDIRLLRETVKTKLNLEMGANKEIIKIALDLKPDIVTLVPENRQELTTEGGLDIISQKKKLVKVINKMENRGIPVSIFCDPDPKQLVAAKEVGAAYVELHTGTYCDAVTDIKRDDEYRLLVSAAERAREIGLGVFAGHGLDYQNTAPIAALDTIQELSIGHAIISRAVFTGLDQAVREMLAIINQADLSI